MSKKGSLLRTSVGLGYNTKLKAEAKCWNDIAFVMIKSKVAGLPFEDRTGAALKYANHITQYFKDYEVPQLISMDLINEARDIALSSIEEFLDHSNNPFKTDEKTVIGDPASKVVEHL